MAAIGLAQSRGDGAEAPVVTSGDDLEGVAHLLGEGAGYSAADVLDYLTAAESFAAA